MSNEANANDRIIPPPQNDNIVNNHGPISFGQYPASNGHCSESNDESMFGLYSQEEGEKRVLAGVDSSDSTKTTKPNLRCISLPDGGMCQKSQNNSHTSPELQNASSIDNVHAPLDQQNSLDEPGKPSRRVSNYYKKQNELLENFKSDSEQIEAFKKTRSRQRLNSTSSVNEKSEKKAGPRKRSVSAGQSEEKEIVAISESSTPQPTSVSNLSTTAAQGEKQALLAVQEEDRLSNVSVVSKDSLLARHEAAAAEEKKTSRAAARLAMVTLIVNIALMIAKMTASYLSGSISIISSLVDSIVDITSGLVLSVSTRMIRKRDPYLYPRGRTRLEPLSLILISVIMGMASLQLIIQSITRIYDGYMYFEHGVGDKPELDVAWASVAIMSATIVVKFTLFCVCQKYKRDHSIAVLAMDHRNDCISNTVALACGWLGTTYWYYFDPIGAMLVSVYILYTWVKTGREHIVMLSGKSAEPEFINRIIKVCIDHDDRISHLDTVYVYHYGTKFLVEVHIVLDERMMLKDAHDISESLQINIESLPEVERAFVHTDYDYDHHPQDEHKLV